MTVLTKATDQCRWKDNGMDESSSEKEEGKWKPKHCLQSTSGFQSWRMYYISSKNKRKILYQRSSTLTQDLGSLSLLGKNHKPSRLQTAGLPFLAFSHPHMQLIVR